MLLSAAPDRISFVPDVEACAEGPLKTLPDFDFVYTQIKVFIQIWD